MQISRLNLADCCKKLGSSLVLPAGLVGSQLLWALAGKESSFGADMNPRHEPSYCHGGKYFDKVRSEAWGCWAHCSYGPWQLMYANAPTTVSPFDLLTSPMICGMYAVKLIQGRIIGVEKAQNLDEIANAYNAGDWRTRHAPPEYVADVVKNYAVEIGAMA
jgi:hypothetical protein